MKLDRLWPYLDEQDELGADASGAEPEEDAEVDAENASEPEADESEPEEDDEESDEQSLLDLMKSEGLELEASDDLTAARLLMEQAKQAKAYQQRLSELEQQRQYEAYLAAQRQQPQQPQSPKSAWDNVAETSVLKHWKARPDFNPKWLSMVQRDDKGNLVPVSGADPTLPTKVNQYLDWQRDALETIATDPIRLVREAMYADPDVSQAIQYMIEERVGRLAAEIKAQQITEKSAAELFETDAKGKLVQKNGAYVPNELGKAYQQFVHQLSQSGIVDPEKQHQMALLMARGAVGKSVKAEKSKDSTESKSEKKLRFLKTAATKTPKRSGSSSNSARNAIESVNELEQELMRQLSGLN